MSRKHQLHLGDTYYDIAHKIGDFVYLRARDEPIRGQVTGYHVRTVSVLYAITWGTGSESSHYDFELSTSAFVGETTDSESEETCEE